MKRYLWFVTASIGLLFGGAVHLNPARMAAEELPEQATSEPADGHETGVKQSPDRSSGSSSSLATWSNDRPWPNRPETHRGPGPQMPPNFPSGGLRGNGSQRWPRSWPNVPTEMTADSGFFFADGKYVLPPYVIKQTADGISINGRAIELANSHGEQRRRPFGEGVGEVEAVAAQLNSGASIVSWNDSPCVTLLGTRSTQLLKTLSGDQGKQQIKAIISSLPSDVDRTTWQAWLQAFEPSSDFLTRASATIAEVERLESDGRAAVNSVQRLRDWAYPLTVLGMVLAVFSLGHLLQCPPRGLDELKPSRRRAALCRATVVSLLLIAALSGLDLVWTLLASHAGQMAELNPIGTQLLGNPLHLSLFKITATVASCSLLMFLRRHPRAQLATWWMCLICTVLTFRWLVLHSMFIT